MGKPIYLGKNAVVSGREIIGIFDFETSTVMKSTREYLAMAEQRGEVENISNDIPSKFLVKTGKNGERKIFLCDKIKL